MIDMHPPPAYVQMVQAQAPNPSPGPNPSASPSPSPSPDSDEPPKVEVRPLNVGQYLPENAIYASIVVTVTPPTGTIVIYTPGYEGSPAVFHGPKESGEIRINGPTVYVHLEDGATAFHVQYLDWHTP